MIKKEVRVRFAPSPTGPLHIGSVRTAMFNFLFARKNNGRFILRLEDTDQKRFVPGAEQYILDSLKWAGIEIDEGIGKSGEYGPYKQSERIGVYWQYIDQLIESGNAYYAFDTPEELENWRLKQKEKGIHTPQYDANSRLEMKNALSLGDVETRKCIADAQPYVVRIKMPESGKITFNDLVRGNVTFDTGLLDDKVLLKADGFPTYHLANVVDDHLMKISHVIRGEEWLNSTPLHIYLYDAFGWKAEMPEFAHLPLILKPEGKGKLSKRDGDKHGFPVFPINWKDPASGDIFPGFRETGFLPEAFVNMLAFLGWNPGNEQEIFSMNGLIAEFSLEKINKAGARFDFEKAKWYNQQFLQKINNKEIAALLQPVLKKKGYHHDTGYIEKVSDLMKERATFVNDVITNGLYFFEDPVEYDAKTVKKKWKDNSATIVLNLADIFEKSEVFNHDVLEKEFKQYVEQNGFGFGVCMSGLRLVITGKGGGPDLFSIMELIGKTNSIGRIKQGIKRLEINRKAK
jgi:glutamyl-tRNA synthetase